MDQQVILTHNDLTVIVSLITKEDYGQYLIQKAGETVGYIVNSPGRCFCSLNGKLGQFDSLESALEFLKA